ncbi:hypothetical protein AB0C65_25805 [Nocardia sp. NPDC048505]
MTVSVQATAAGGMVLTNADSARSVVAEVGHDIEVRLTSYRENGVTYTWHLPTSSSPALPRVSGSLTPTGHTEAVFHTDDLGDSVITAERTCHPDPNRKCPATVRPWKAAIRVK